MEGKGRERRCAIEEMEEENWMEDCEGNDTGDGGTVGGQ